jgi:hypothetical protein
MLTDPPDGNIFCFAVNRAGNASLEMMNRFNQAIYDKLKFNPEAVIQHHNFIISSTELTFNQYGLKCSRGGCSLDEHLAALGIAPEEFGERLDKTKTTKGNVDLPCVGVFELRDGKIKEWRDYFDLATYRNALKG